jgi:signal transduction histidine kinase
MRWPIRYQLLAPLLVLLLGVVAASIWTAAAAAHRATQRVEDRVRDNARSLETAGDYLRQKTVLEIIKHYSGMDYYVVSKDGAAGTFPAGEKATLPPDSAVYDSAAEMRLGPRVVVGGKAFRASGLRRRMPGEVVYVYYPDGELEGAVWEAVRPVLVLGGLVTAAAVFLAVVVGRRLSRRVRDLERQTRHIADGDFSPMPLPSRDDEIRDLTRSVNDMAHKLAQFQDTVRRSERLRLLGQVSGGLAHQLRNGVTGARLAIQLYLQEAETPTDTAALDVALRQLTLLEMNLKRFLDLGSERSLRPERCDLAGLVTEAVELHRPQCRHANIELGWSAADGRAVLTADRGQLEQVISNVLGNAVEAAGPGGRVEVRLARDAAANGAGEDGAVPLVLEIADSGPGPPAAIADRLFEPFVTGKPEGVGLGLAVARQVVEGMGGHITWRRFDGRTCFRIELPPSQGDSLETRFDR